MLRRHLTALIKLLPWILGAYTTTPQVSGDEIDRWNEAILQGIRADNLAPPLASRNLALVSIAMFDAANAIQAKFQPYRKPTASNSNALVEAAFVSAAYHTSSKLFPSRQGEFDRLWNNAKQSWLPEAARDDGIDLGSRIAAELLELRAGDGSHTQLPYIPSTAPGAWRRTPPFFRPPDVNHWGRMTPFSLQKNDQFRPPGPPALNSPRYAKDLNEVKQLGSSNSSHRTKYQTESAQFWSDFTGTVTPLGHWNQIARNIAETRSLPSLEKLRLLALLNIAMADAAIAAWDAKYTYNLWRPMTAIQRADEDNNSETTPAKDWQSLLHSPPFPDYVSGHSTFSSAAGQILTEYFQTDSIQFSVGSDTVHGVIRTYHSLREAVEEVGMSRIYGGIHFRFADEDGQALGKKIGTWVMSHELLPRKSP